MTSILFFCFARRLFASRLFNSNAMYFTRLKGALKWCKKIMFLVQSRINLSLSLSCSSCATTLTSWALAAVSEAVSEASQGVVATRLCPVRLPWIRTAWIFDSSPIPVWRGSSGECPDVSGWSFQPRRRRSSYRWMSCYRFSIFSRHFLRQLRWLCLSTAYTRRVLNSLRFGRVRTGLVSINVSTSSRECTVTSTKTSPPKNRANISGLMRRIR